MSDFEDLKGYEGYYKINRSGQLWSCWYRKPLIPQYKEDYLGVTLTKDRVKQKCYIHRLLCIQYIENPNNYPEVDHIDRNRLNNKLSNLRWVNKTMQNNNKSNNIHNLTEEEQEERKEHIKKYHREYAENKRRELGIPIKSKTTDEEQRRRTSEQSREKRLNISEEERQAEKQKRREKYLTNDEAEKQREYINRPEVKERRRLNQLTPEMREYKRLWAAKKSKEGPPKILTDEERKIRNQRVCENAKRRKANMTPEEREAHLQRRREQYLAKKNAEV